jgi:hypothetical protein
LTSSRTAAIAQIPATVIHAARASGLCSEGAPFTTHILSAIAATSHQLALQYLLELSSDIRLGLFLDSGGGVIAAAPEAPGARLSELARQLAAEAGARFGDGGEPVEIDAVCEGGSVFLIHSDAGSMVCLTDRSVLHPLIFYDMHAVLTDIDRAAVAEARRVGVGER